MHRGQHPRLRAFLVAFTAALAALLSLQPAAADVAVLSDEVLTQLPIWTTNRTADIVLDFSKADPDFRFPGLGTINFRGKSMKVKYHIGYYHGNVAIVRFGSKLVAAVRKMHFYKTLRTDIEAYPISTKPNEGEISWWGSKIAVCSMDTHTLQPVMCQNYDPRTWKECLWNKGFEGTGEWRWWLFDYLGSAEWLQNSAGVAATASSKSPLSWHPFGAALTPQIKPHPKPHPARPRGPPHDSLAGQGPVHDVRLQARPCEPRRHPA